MREDDDRDNSIDYDVPTVGTTCRQRPCGCQVGLLSDVAELPERQRKHVGSLVNPWIVLPCESHRDGDTVTCRVCGETVPYYKAHGAYGPCPQRSQIAHEPVGYLSIVSMSAESALRFFGLDPSVAHAVDMGPPDPSRPYKPGARVFHVYRSAAEMPQTRLPADDDEPPTGLYDWHAATGAEVPHIAVYRHEGGGDETRIADFYIHDGEVGEAENLAIGLVKQLNRPR